MGEKDPRYTLVITILFNLFISDLPSYLGHMGTSLNGVKIPYIQYADDLCILGESAEDLQHGLDGLAAYCAENHLEINVSKMKIQIFHMGRLPQHEFQLNGQAVEIVSNFCYLGFNFSVQISFSQHAHIINSKARAKCGALLASLPLSNLPLPLILQLFDVFVLPTFTYGLPMWLSNCSASSLQAVDATFSKYLKRYLQVPLHSNNSITHFLSPLNSNIWPQRLLEVSHSLRIWKATE